MRLNGFSNPNGDTSKASIFSSATNFKPKSSKFEDFIIDANFRPVEGVVVSDISQEESKIDQAQKYSVYARIDEQRKNLQDQKRGKDRDDQKTNTLSAIKISDKRAEEVRKVPEPQTQAKDPNQALREEVAQLRSEVANIKTLARSNRDAINAMAPMQRPRFQSTYNNSTTNNSENTTLSQADIHYLRYGGEQRALDIWA